jgi:murein DD-endopeptidase MepM/ murein hydrolase activator NlpD
MIQVTGIFQGNFRLIGLYSNPNITIHLFRTMKRTIAFFILINISLSIINAQSVKLFGEAKPGNVVIGKTEKVKNITLDKIKLPIDKSGYFIFGFDRDAKGTHVLKIRYKNRKTEIRKIILQKRKYEIQRLNIADKYVTPPKDELKRIKKEIAEMKSARKDIGKIDTAFYSSGFVYPVENSELIGSFGSQRILNGVRKKPHNGVDFNAEEGAPVSAISDGKVIIAGTDFYYNGSFILLAHGQGLTSVYLHLSKIDVKTGDKVLKGQKIGEVGSTGRSTGSHLHLGIQLFNKRIDPLSLLEMKLE